MKTKQELEVLLPFFKAFTKLNSLNNLTEKASDVSSNLWDIHHTLCHEQGVLERAINYNTSHKTQVDIDNLKEERKYKMPYDYPFKDFYLGRQDLNDNHMETLFKNLAKKV